MSESPSYLILWAVDAVLVVHTRFEIPNSVWIDQTRLGMISVAHGPDFLGYDYHYRLEYSDKSYAALGELSLRRLFENPSE